MGTLTLRRCVVEDSPAFLDDETLTDNLTDDIAGPLLNLAEKIWKKLPESVESFLKIIRLVNDIAETEDRIGWDNFFRREASLALVERKAGIHIPRPHKKTNILIADILKELEKKYGC